MPPKGKKPRQDGDDVDGDKVVNDMELWLSSEKDEFWIRAAIRTQNKTVKSNSDKNPYQLRIKYLEDALLSNSLCPSLNTPRITQEGKKDILIPTAGDGDGKASDNKFYLTTVSGDGSSCHAILVYVKTNGDGSKTVYCYDPAGKSATRNFTTHDPAVIKKPSVKPSGKLSGKPSSELVQINMDMCPHQGINPEGYCALWSIVVVILWDLDPTLDFDGRLSILKLFNILIAGGIDDKGREIKKVIGLRKWFIARVYHFIMRRGAEYSSAESARDFIKNVRDHIQMTLSYHSNPDIMKHVEQISKYVSIHKEKKNKLSNLLASNEINKNELNSANENNTRMLDKAVDMYFEGTMGQYKKTLTTATAPGGGGGAAVDAAVDAGGGAAVDAGGGDVDLDADGGAAGGGAAGGGAYAGFGGLRRVRSVRHKNKMYRSKKVRKPRRTVKRRSRRNRRN